MITNDFCFSIASIVTIAMLNCARTSAVVFQLFPKPVNLPQKTVGFNLNSIVKPLFLINPKKTGLFW